MSFGKRQALNPLGPSDSVASRLSHVDVVVIISCSAAALISAYVAAEVIWPMLGVPKELRPLGGVQLDMMPEVVRPWAPKYVSVALSAIASFIAWRHLTFFGPKASIFRGAFVMAALSMLSMLITFEVLHIGAFVQMWPMLAGFGAIMNAFVGCILIGLGYSVFYIAFFAVTMLPVSLISGAIIAGVTRVALER